MIFVGKRQVGKTYEAIEEVVSRCNDGDVVGVISYNPLASKFLKKLVEKRLLVKGVSNVKVEVIKLEDRGMVDHVLIDELDMLLGKNCVCATGGVVSLVGTGIDNDYTYKEALPSKTRLLLNSIYESLPRPFTYDTLHISKDKAEKLHRMWCPEYDIEVETKEGIRTVSVILENEEYVLCTEMV